MPGRGSPPGRGGPSAQEIGSFIPMIPAMSLGVLETTLPVVEKARHVRLERGVLHDLAARWKESGFGVPGWDSAIHYPDANYVLLLDALNFCFWADPDQPRWEVDYHGQSFNGYKALSVALRRAVEEGVPLLEADWLASISREQMAHLLRGRGEIPMLDDRVANAREVGQVLSRGWEGRFERIVEAAGGSAVELVRLVERELTSFRDVCTYDGAEVRILKRAQILVVDLFGTFQGQGPGELTGLEQLTAFADYKIPQVLRAQGVLVYSDELAETVDNRILIPAGDPREVEIRAAMVWAVEKLRQGLAKVGRQATAYELDWFLWNLGQRPVENERPYHLTRTIYY